MVSIIKSEANQKRNENIASDKIQENNIICENSKTYKWNIVWFNVILLGALHLGAIYGVFFRQHALLSTILFGKALGVIATMGVTAGAHRLWCHRSYKANNICQIILISMMTMTYQNSVLTWCRDHRLHHKHSETDADPHNSKRGFFFSHIGWLLVRKHPDVKEKGRTIDMSDLKTNPIVMFQHKYYYGLVIMSAFVMPVLVPFYIFGETLKIAFLITLVRFMLQLNLTWCINSIAHIYGNKPYNKSIGPAENPFMMICGLGEGFHNYHHTYPSDYRAAEFGSDARNLTTILIDMFAKLGWVTDRITTTKAVIDSRIKKTGDGSYRSVNTLKSIILVIIFLYFV